MSKPDPDPDPDPDDPPDSSRVAQALRLAHADRVDLALLDALIDAGGAPAAYVLRHARSLGRPRLAALATSLPADLAGMIARRADLDAATALALLARPEPALALALAANRGARFSAEVCRGLARRALREPGLAEALTARPVDPRAGAALFLHAGPQARAEILRRARVEDLLGPRRDLADLWDDEAPARIERLGLAGDRGACVEALATTLGARTVDVATLLADPSGEAAAILLAAVGVTAPAAARLFLAGLAGEGREAAEVHGLVSILARLSQRAARRLVAAMCGGLTVPVRQAARYVPVYDPAAALRPGRIRAGAGRRAGAAPGRMVSGATRS